MAILALLAIVSYAVASNDGGKTHFKSDTLTGYQEVVGPGPISTVGTGTFEADLDGTTLSYTFLYARQLGHDTVSQRPLGFRPRHLLTLGADYARGELGVGADFRYSSRFERVELTPTTDPRVAAKVLDLRAAWAHGPVSVRLLVANVLNYLYNYAPRTLEPVRTMSVTFVYIY